MDIFLYTLLIDVLPFQKVSLNIIYIKKANDGKQPSLAQK